LRTFRLMAATAAAVTAMALSASSALAQGPTTNTDVTDVTTSDHAGFPCTSEVGVVTISAHLVTRTTLAPSGRFSFEQQISGSIDFQNDDPARPSYTGKLSADINQTGQLLSDGTLGPPIEFISNSKTTARGTDGSKVKLRLKVRETINANGEVTADVNRATCD
jgi:hypothetical protein